MMRLLVVELRRDLARRLTRLLVLLAVVIIAVITLAVYGANKPLEDESDLPPGLVTMTVAQDDDPRVLTSLWPEEEPVNGYLMVPVLFLTITAFIAGASMVGAEWKAGTFTNLLTWEPRRTRVLASKFAAAGILAGVIAAGLLVLYVGAFLPTIFGKGTTEGADGDWYRWLAAGIVRIALVTGLAATFGAAIATIGRNTSAAVGVAFGYFMVVENLVRGLRPRWQPWLVSENTVLWVTDARVDIGFDRGGGTAGVTLLCYVAVVALAAWILFTRRDVAGAT